MLNFGVLPKDYFALAEQRIQGPIPDVLTLKLDLGKIESEDQIGGGLAVAQSPPKTAFIQRSEEGIYAGKADRISIHHRHGDVVAIIEIVSPGNKKSTGEIRTFIRKTVELIQRGVHILVIDLFPPSKRDPQGIPGLIWDELFPNSFTLPAGKPLTLGSYDAGPERVAYVEPFAVGDELKDMPLFLHPEYYVPTPLEKSYIATWEMFPNPMKKLLLA